MPATARQIERHFTQPSDDQYEETCPGCEGLKGYEDQDYNWVVCGVCKGEGTVDPETAAEYRADGESDRLFELAGDR